MSNFLSAVLQKKDGVMETILTAIVYAPEQAFLPVQSFFSVVHVLPGPHRVVTRQIQIPRMLRQHCIWRNLRLNTVDKHLRRLPVMF